MVDFNDTNALSHIADLRKRGEEEYLRALAPQYGIPYVNLFGVTINPEALMKIPERTAKESRLVAFALMRNTLSVAVNRPNDTATKAALALLEKKGFTVLPHIASTASIDHGLARYADQKTTTASKKGVLDINPDDILRRAHTMEKIEDVATAIDTVSRINSPRRISETLELMFAGALALRASDIHIEPTEQHIRLRYRLDGVLLDVATIDNHLYGRLMSRLKLLSGMRLNERKEAQDGRFEFVFGERAIEVRSSIIPGAVGESIVMRLLDPGVASFSMDKLALNPFLRARMEQELKRPNGLIITTGPTGSGKTTALYAFLRAVHDSEKKIITIENPVEYKLDGIVQTQTGPDYSFASGLRAILRQDPDIIMIGEIRDREVAETAIHAAQTGHLVFSTLHTNSAAGGFPRLIDLGVDPRIISSSLNIMLGQRLVRVLCEHCKKPRVISTEEITMAKKALSSYPEPVTIDGHTVVYDSVGCDACGHTGFSGRVGVFEAIAMDDRVEDIVIRDPREHMILDAALPQHIPTMLQDGLIKVLSGLTTFDELERVVDVNQSRRVVTDTKSDDRDDDFFSHIV